MEEIKSTWVFGKVAQALGMITADEAEEAAATQEELEGEGITLKFGEVLAEGKIITEKQVEEVMAAQGSEQPDPDDALFGTIAVENGFLEQEGLEDGLEIQQDLGEELAEEEKVPKIGEILLTEEQMEPGEVEVVLKIQQRLRIGAFALTPSKLLLLRKKKKTLRVRSPEDALFCKVAVRRKMLTPEQVSEILRMQMADPRPRSVGEFAYELGFLDQIDVAAIEEIVARKEGVKERKKKHKTTAGIQLIKEDVEFSAVAMKNGFVTETQLKKAEKAFKMFQYLHYPRNLGEIMFDMR
ncbi:MAG: hypothetical protein ACYTHM_09700, partial [Planctomycetota bacterium]